MAEQNPDAENATSTPELKAKEISENLLAIIQKACEEHVQWMNQWYQWATNTMMQMQMVSPQAYQEFENRQNWLNEFVMSFKPTALILKEAGQTELATMIDNTEKGARKNAAMYKEARAKMAAGDRATQQKILDIQRRTSDEILRMQRDTMADQRRSMDRSHDNFMDGLRG